MRRLLGFMARIPLLSSGAAVGVVHPHPTHPMQGQSTLPRIAATAAIPAATTSYPPAATPALDSVSALPASPTRKNAAAALQPADATA